MMRRRGIGKRVAAGVLAVMLAVGTTPVDLSGIFENSGIVALADTVTVADAGYTATSEEGSVTKITDFPEVGFVTAKWEKTGETLTGSDGNTATVLQNQNTIKNGTYASSTGVLYIDTSTAGKFQPNSDDGSGGKRIQVNAGTKIYVPALGNKTETRITFTSNSYSNAKKSNAVRGIDSDDTGFRGSTVRWEDERNSCLVISYTKIGTENIEIDFGSNVYLESIETTSFAASMIAGYGMYTNSIDYDVSEVWKPHENSEVNDSVNGLYQSDEHAGYVFVDAHLDGAYLKYCKGDDGEEWTEVGAGTVLYLPVNGYRTITEIELYQNNNVSDVEALAKEGVSYVSTNVQSSIEDHGDRVSAVITTYGDGEQSELILTFNTTARIGYIKSTTRNTTATISGTVTLESGEIPDDLAVEVSLKATDDTSDILTRKGTIAVDENNKSTGTYSVTVPQDNKKAYTMELSREDYLITSEKTSYSAGEMTMNGATNNLTIRAGAVEKYAVKVNMPSADSAGSENLKVLTGSGDNLKYVFTRDNRSTEMKYSELSGLKLAAGTYTLSLEGTALDQLPYQLAEKCKTVNVTSSENVVNIELERITTWLFGNAVEGGGGFSSEIQKSTGWFNGLYIDATSGKLSATAEKRKTNAQFNNNTIIKVPVNEPCKITVMATNGTYTIGGRAATGGKYSYVYTGDSGTETTVEVKSTADNEYITSITVEPISTVKVSGKVTIEGGTIPDGLKVVLTNGSAEAYEAAVNTSDGSYSLNLPSSETGITYTMSMSDAAYEITSDKTEVTATTKSDIADNNITCEYGVTHKVTLKLGDGLTEDEQKALSFTFTPESGTGKTYNYVDDMQLRDGIYTITVDGLGTTSYKVDGTPSVTVSGSDTEAEIKFTLLTEWLFGSAVGYNLKLEGSSNGEGTYRGLEIDATKGKLDGANNTNSAQFKAGTIIKVPVSGACTVKVYTTNSRYSVNDVDAAGTAFDYVYPGGDGYVTIKSTALNGGSDYITKIEVIPGGDAVTVSGTVTYAGSESIEGMQLIFTNTSDSKQTYYATVENGKYSLKLPATETSMDFTVSLDVSSEYEISGGDVTFAVNKSGGNLTENVTLIKKFARDVTVKLGSGPTLDDVTFRFTRTDKDSIYEEFTYEQVSGGEIQLYDGTYRLSLVGDAFRANQSYRVTSNMELTVGSGENVFPITFEKAVSWKFNGKTGDTDDYYSLTGTEGKTVYYNGLAIDATAVTGNVKGKLDARLDADKADTQANIGTIIKVPVTGACTVTVTTKSTTYSPMITVGTLSGTTVTGTTGTTASASTTYNYTGTEGYVAVKVNAIEGQTSAYLTSISVTYPGDDTADVEQKYTPTVPDDGVLHGNVKGGMSVDAVGQKLNLTQTGGNFTNADGISYYVFPATGDSNVLEFDVVIKSAAGTSSDTGFFGGIFTKNYQYTIAMRKASTDVRGTYSKGADTFSSATGGEYTIKLGTKVHYKVTVSDGKAEVTASFVDAYGNSVVDELSQTMIDDGGQYYYGMALADVGAEVTNMKYYHENGNNADDTVYYYQNDAYKPLGSIPVPKSAKAESASGTISEYVHVSWDGDLAENDGYYELWVRTDKDTTFTKVAEDITDLYYDYKLTPASNYKYTFQVVGVLGKGSQCGGRSNPVTSNQTQQITGMLAAPVVTATGSTDSITLKWKEDKNASKYTIYRYSYDDGAGNAKELTTLTGSANTTYTDKDVTQEMPYYYYVVAENGSNKSSPSETVWAVATSGHTGTYVYENEAAEIFISEKSNDTVFTGTAVLKGNIYNIDGAGTLVVKNGDTVAGTQGISKSGDSFAFEITLNDGRNDVNLLFTDKDGKVTRKTYNFVYLTNYDIYVDSSLGETADETNVDGKPQYNTIQAAVDSVDANNADRVVILVAAGDYNERLVVNKPNVTIIGQDRDNTLVHCYPADIYKDSENAVKYEAGGDMSMRCATYITSAATNFNAENISFKNDYDYSTADGKSNKSADALRVDADNASFVNVKMTSVQDTLYMNQGKQFYYKCRIEGLVDYIYSGDDARALFDDCELVFLYQSTKSGGYVCAPKTASSASYGLTFRNCVVTGEDGCEGSDYKLARPWGADAYVTWINCYMGKSVCSTLPYSDMNGSYEAARFYEYGSYGPGYEINAARRQISETKAKEMVSDSYLGWAPYTTIIQRAESYKGSLKSELTETTNTATRVSYLYDKSDGADEDVAFKTNIARYNMEGYASVYGVTGGGLQKEVAENKNYYKVGTAEEFLQALVDVKASGKASTIELTADIKLGSKEVTNFANYSDVIKEYGAQALLHPTLIESGVSIVTITKMHNLTIFSQNGSAIKHANITFKNSSNIIIRNIKFDELWEWDEETEGGYDRNDWDYMTIDTGSDGIWVDHCTFYKAYDGVIDVKNPDGVERVTISWCEFLPGSENDTFFDEMMNLLKDNPTQYKYYNSLLESGMTDEEIRLYAYGQKKTHLFGQSAEATNAVGIRVTLANNTYTNSMDRMPRLRYGIAHVYNCIMDASTLFTAKQAIAAKNATAAKHIVSNGVSSTCDGQILVENSYINNIINALNSGNGSDTSGYINAINSVYYIMGTRYQLVPKVNTTKVGEVVKTTNADEFKSALGYTYNLRDAEKLSTEVAPFAGAGKLTMSVLQWEKTKYNAEYTQELAVGEGLYTNNNLPTSPYQSDEVGNESGSGENGGDSAGGAGSGGSVNVGNSGTGNDDYSSDGEDDDSTSGSGSGSNSSSGLGSGSTGTTGSTDINTTPVTDVLTAEDIPGAETVMIDDATFTQLGDFEQATKDVIQNIDSDGRVSSEVPVSQTTSELAQAITQSINEGFKDVSVFASENADVTADMINGIIESGGVASIGIVGSDGTVKAILTLDGSSLQTASTNFSLKITVDPQSSSVRTKVANLGIGMNSYTVIDFDFSGDLPGVFKVAVDVSDKFVDGTQLALYYNNEQAGRLENQYQVTTVNSGFAEFAINHCSEYVLMDVSAARNMITTNTLTAPKTGDTNHLVLWVTMMGIVAAVYFGFEACVADKKKANGR